MKLTFRLATLPRYSKAFWFSYFFCMTWAILAITSIYLFAPNNDNFQNLDNVEAALSVKLSVRRIFAVLIGAITITVLLFSQSKYLDKVLIFIAAWMWAAYIDDYLVMYPYVYVPEEIFAQFVIKLRPVIVILVSWMAFESHLRREAAL